MTSNGCKTESTGRSRDLGGKTSLELTLALIGFLAKAFLKTSSGGIEPVFDQSNCIFRGRGGGHHTIAAVTVVVNHRQLVHQLQFHPHTWSMWPKSNFLAQYLCLRKVWEESNSSRPDSRRVVRGNLSHPIVILPRPTHCDIVLSRNYVDVVAVQCHFHPRSFHLYDLASQGHQRSVTS